ncbi:hypothetical protein SAMN05444398_11376 [Roseovarius pacificus]|uniref:Uncharacterized protein n=1 Tax=Roseovarius pacificus TaxID=337701 RepID=A0A1M7HRU1_9RHOB|nr:hypothetical protein SAMN05444398_11376 [Roseovarius pacificus]
MCLPRDFRLSGRDEDTVDHASPERLPFPREIVAHAVWRIIVPRSARRMSRICLL